MQQNVNRRRQTTYNLQVLRVKITQTMEIKENTVLVILGASGDLAKKKLV